MKWRFIIFINILCPFVISKLDLVYIERTKYFFNEKVWTNQGFPTLELMLKDYLEKHPDYEPCKTLIKQRKNVCIETMKCTSRREVFTPENGVAVTLDGSTYFSVPSMFRCYCQNPGHDFYMVVFRHFGTKYLRLENIYPDGIKDNQTAYSPWWLYTQKAVRQTYEDPDSYNQMADWYERKFHSNMHFTCQSLRFKGLQLQNGSISLIKSLVQVDGDKTIEIPGYLCCLYIDINHPNEIVDRYFVATRPRFMWTHILYSNVNVNHTPTFYIF